MSIDELIEVYEIDDAAALPRHIGVFDDVLTAGPHFRATHTVLASRFPGVPITGIFIARRVFHESAYVDWRWSSPGLMDTL